MQISQIKNLLFAWEILIPNAPEAWKSYPSEAEAVAAAFGIDTGLIYEAIKAWQDKEYKHWKSAYAVVMPYPTNKQIIDSLHRMFLLMIRLKSEDNADATTETVGKLLVWAMHVRRLMNGNRDHAAGEICRMLTAYLQRHAPALCAEVLHRADVFQTAVAA